MTDIPTVPSPPAITYTTMQRVGCYAFDAPEALRRLANLMERQSIPADLVTITLSGSTLGYRAYATFPHPADLG